MDNEAYDKQKELDLRYLRMAQIWAENSYCQRRKVGALIVKDTGLALSCSGAHRVRKMIRTMTPITATRPCQPRHPKAMTRPFTCYWQHWWLMWFLLIQSSVMPLARPSKCRTTVCMKWRC